MLYRKIIAVCSEIHTKHINTVCGQNVQLLNVKLVVHHVTRFGIRGRQNGSGGRFLSQNFGTLLLISLRSFIRFSLTRSNLSTICKMIKNNEFRKYGRKWSWRMSTCYQNICPK